MKKLKPQKEELQSLNEELTTVNSELESRIEQLSSANDDIKNLLDNTEIATIFLDKDLCIKRFTPRATEIINLIPTDVGRPINHIVSNLEYDRLMEDARRVLKTLESKTTEVVDKSGRWYFVRIIPYRTVNNIIDGVVITFLNIHNQKKAENELMRLESQHKITQEIVEKLINDYSCPALVLDKNFQILLLNNCFIKQFKEKEANLLSQNLFKIKLNMEKDILRHFLEEFVAHKTEHNECKIKINGSDYSISVQKMNSILLLLLNK